MSLDKVLPTTYKGVRFKSRTEARWAVFFELCGYTWAYEPEGVKLSTGETYLPDFYLLGFRLWVEVKSDHEELSETTIQKSKQLAVDTGRDAIILRGQPGVGAHLYFDCFQADHRCFAEWFSNEDGDLRLKIDDKNPIGIQTVWDADATATLEMARGHVFPESRPNR